jgi:hypothetical protein|tara:strand:+ start:449 stop:742 length:294 start_codon:yes stop_codon:yes gene_type:complete
MMHSYLSKIKSLQSKIDTALKESSFEKLAILSSELGTSVESLISDPNYKNSITQQELINLQNLLISVQNYQQETSLKFRDYSLKVSRKRKMHQAYKQ